MLEIDAQGIIKECDDTEEFIKTDTKYQLKWYFKFNPIDEETVNELMAGSMKKLEGLDSTKEIQRGCLSLIRELGLNLMSADEFLSIADESRKKIFIKYKEILNEYI